MSACTACTASGVSHHVGARVGVVPGLLAPVAHVGRRTCTAQGAVPYAMHNKDQGPAAENINETTQQEELLGKTLDRSLLSVLLCALAATCMQRSSLCSFVRVQQPAGHPRPGALSK